MSFTFGENFRPMIEDLINAGLTPKQQFVSIQKKLHLIGKALERKSFAFAQSAKNNEHSPSKEQNEKNGSKMNFK